MAVQETLGRRVAVKVLPRHALGSARSRERFLREARVAARLRHPNIIPIHEIGEQDGVPYFVMPLIDGEGLDRLLAERSGVIPGGPRERALWVAALGRQAALALAYSHSQDVLHRDIKPSNLLLDVAGTLWLADFGLAKLADEFSLTGTGDLPGTLRYLAPECLHREGDTRSDIYSLGLTLYELLVGRPAFAECDRARLLHQIQSHPVTAPRQLVSGLPRDLETIVMKAYAFEPAARYPTAAAMADDLARFLDGRPIRARRASPLERLVRWASRNRVVTGLAASSVVLGLIAAFFFALFLLAPPHPEQARAVPAPPSEPTPLRSDAEKLEPDRPAAFEPPARPPRGAFKSAFGPRRKGFPGPPHPPPRKGEF
jgi:serine/threonine protein kinase